MAGERGVGVLVGPGATSSPSPTGSSERVVLPGRSPPLRRGRVMVVLLVSAALLGSSLALPWWTETELFGGERWTQSYAPFSGVSGVCSPACGFPSSGPPTGPVNGTRTFTSLNLSSTRIVYFAEVGVVGAALALALVAAAVAGRAPARHAALTRWRRLVLVAAGLSVVLLPLVQPLAFASDVTRSFGQGDAVWTPSPSPETSFWGACTRGLNGLCASGGSVAWGPALGWYLMLLGFLLVLALEFGGLRVDLRAAPGAGTAPVAGRLEPVPTDLQADGPPTGDAGLVRRER